MTTDVIGWGRAAATRLLELIDQREPTEFDLDPPRLVVRGSTGPAPVDVAAPRSKPKSKPKSKFT